MSRPIVDPARLEANWQAITAELDAPCPGRLERVLRRVGIAEPTARLMAATPALRRAWFVATGLALVFALTASGRGDVADRYGLFLTIAPLVPTVGVALAYGPGSDPAHEVTVATPMSGLQLVLTRATAVFACSLPIVAATGVALPGSSWYAAAWLIPALAATAACVTLTTFTSPKRAALAVVAAWLLTMAVVNARTGDVLVAFGLVGQLVAGAVAVAGFAAVVARRGRFDVLGATG